LYYNFYYQIAEHHPQDDKIGERCGAAIGSKQERAAQINEQGKITRLKKGKEYLKTIHKSVFLVVHKDVLIVRRQDDKV
jgi:hypothetical protein